MSSNESSRAVRFVNGDARPDAPVLAPRGPYRVGVRTLSFVNADQPDITRWQVSHADPMPRYDRRLTVEIWYPAQVDVSAAARAAEWTEYTDKVGMAGDPARPHRAITFAGRACRDALPDSSAGPYPLVIVSHGYAGSRYLLTYLTENLASKGFVVAAIDHQESTHTDRGLFEVTLYHRHLDIQFVLSELGHLGAGDGAHSFLAGLVDVNRTALVGYSMGGYGSLNVAGARFSEPFAKGAIPGLTLPDFATHVDSRIKAVVAIAPWGANYGAWDAAGLAAIHAPLLLVVGDQDDVAGYENGSLAIFNGAVNANRYLLTLINARHNVGPNPPPDEPLLLDDYMHYAEPAWDVARINNIVQHFASAFLYTHLQARDHRRFLDPAGWAEAGFPPRTAVGLNLQYRQPAS